MSFKLETFKKENSDLLDLLTKNLPDMLWVKDLEGNYLYANEALCRGLLMAKNSKEVIGKNDLFFATRERKTHKENKQWHTFGELCFNSDQEVINQKRAMKFEENGNIKGEMLYLEVFKAPVYDENNNLIGTVGTGRDITKLKMVQLELEEKNKEIQRLNAQLELKIDEQEGIMLHQSRQVVMGEILESIAHQWRQPLNIIGLAAAKLEMEYHLSGFDEEEFLQTMKLFSENINLMSSTIDDFRKFLHPYKEDANFSPSEVLQETSRILMAQFQGLKIAYTDELLSSKFIKGAENEFKQVLLILFNNAIDAIKDKNIVGKIHVKIYERESDVIVELSDNAGGVKEDIIAKIFDAYFSTKGVSSGTGIGLYLAKNIIENRMKGSLSVKNMKDGCCFSICLSS